MTNHMDNALNALEFLDSDELLAVAKTAIDKVVLAECPIDQLRLTAKAKREAWEEVRKGWGGGYMTLNYIRGRIEEFKDYETI